MTRYLIVNADDLGLSPGVNRGIFAAHRAGIVTSASLMVWQPGADHAARKLRNMPRLSVGLHLDLGEWEYQQGRWRPRYEYIAMCDFGNRMLVRDAIRRQLDRFRELTGREPSHFDSHQHVHHNKEICDSVVEICGPLGIPVRHYSPQISYCGAFYGQTGKGEPWPEGIQLRWLVRLIDSLPAGVTELACHPGLDSSLPTAYAEERKVEVVALCSSVVRAAINTRQIRLISFADLTAFKAPPNGAAQQARGVLSR